MVQTEKSGTLGVSQDQTLITIENKTQPQAVVYGLCSDGSNSMRSSNPYSGIYEADSSRTLDNNGGNPACNQGGMIVVDREPMCIQRRFSSVNVFENGISPTLEAGAGEGGNNMPMVTQEQSASGLVTKGDGYKEADIMYTLNTIEQHAVCTCKKPEIHSESEHIPCIAIDRASFNQGENAQYNFSIQEEIAQPLLAKKPGGVLTQLEHCAQETTKE